MFWPADTNGAFDMYLAATSFAPNLLYAGSLQFKETFFATVHSKRTPRSSVRAQSREEHRVCAVF
jgi:hypothetical protein